MTDKTASSEASILDLVAQMAKARETGQTDEEEKQTIAATELAREIWHSCAKFHLNNGGPLDTYLCLQAVAITLGALIDQHKQRAVPLSGLIIATELCELILKIANR